MCIRDRGWIVQRHRRCGDVTQFDVLVSHIVDAATAIWRMVHDLANDDWANARPGVFTSWRAGNLRHEMFLACADHVATKRDAVFSGTEGKPVAVTGEIGRARLAGQEVHHLTV